VITRAFLLQLDSRHETLCDRAAAFKYELTSRPNCSAEKIVSCQHRIDDYDCECGLPC